eukprot:99773_1
MHQRELDFSVYIMSRNHQYYSLFYDDNNANVFDDESHFKEDTSCYFIEDTKHDYSTALCIVKKDLIALKQFFDNELQTPLEVACCSSDNGEFKCTAFLLGLAELSYELNIYIWWDFFAAQHGKRKVDSIGSTTKRAERKGVLARELIYNTNKPHVVTAANFCTKKFNKRKEQFDAVELKRHQKRLRKG